MIGMEDSRTSHTLELRELRGYSITVFSWWKGLSRRYLPTYFKPEYLCRVGRFPELHGASCSKVAERDAPITFSEYSGVSIVSQKHIQKYVKFDIISELQT